MREIELAGGIRFTGLINNSNLGGETCADDILQSVSYAEDTAKKSGLPLVMTTAEERLCKELEGKIPNLFALHLQKKL
jgi:hypothetical protein